MNRSKRRYKKQKTLESIIIPKLVTKVRVHIYGTSDLHDPNCDVLIKADLWVTTPLHRKSEKPFLYHKSKTQYNGVTINIKKGCLLDNKGNVLSIDNHDAVFNEIIKLLSEETGNGTT